MRVLNEKKCINTLVGVLIAVVAIGLVSLGYQLARHRYNKPFDTKVERDTVTVIDTVPHYYPKPVEVEKLRTEYKWLTRVVTETDTLHDSVLVAVPIESKHYHGEEYDAYISGYLLSLDSIFVYSETQYITETVTKSKPPNKWELDIIGGIDYNIKQQRYTPHAGGELLYKPNRLQLGIRGGVIKNDNFEPYIGGVVKIRIH